MDAQNAIVTKSKAFALRIIKLYQLLERQNERIMSKQLLRCGTSIGANVKEAIRGQTRPDFFAKMNIALKEASETEYWLELLFESGYFLDEQAYASIYADCKEVLAILVAITKAQYHATIK